MKDKFVVIALLTCAIVNAFNVGILDSNTGSELMIDSLEGEAVGPGEYYSSDGRRLGTVWSKASSDQFEDGPMKGYYVEMYLCATTASSDFTICIPGDVCYKRVCWPENWSSLYDGRYGNPCPNYFK